MKLIELIELQKYSPYGSQKNAEVRIKEFFSDNVVNTVELGRSKNIYLKVIFVGILFGGFVYHGYRMYKHKLDKNNEK